MPVHDKKETLNLYLPANCLIGELSHPIELFLHFIGLKTQLLRRGQCVRRCLMSRTIPGEVARIITLKQPGVRLAQAARKLARSVCEKNSSVEKS